MFYDVKILGRRTLLRSFKAINLIIKLNITILKRWIIISPEMVSWWSSWSLIGRIVGCLRLDITVSQTGWLLLRFRNISYLKNRPWSHDELFQIVPRFETEIGHKGTDRWKMFFSVGSNHLIVSLLKGSDPQNIYSKP